jgi:hypothetical protein
VSTNIASLLNDLVETSKDGEKGFRTAAEDTKDAQLKSVFMQRAGDCAKGAAELQQLVSKMGEKPEQGGNVPHWRGIYDDNGRLMVAICHNMDLGDSWEYADDPRYPEKFSALGIRIGINYLMYSMTH